MRRISQWFWLIGLVVAFPLLLSTYTESGFSSLTISGRAASVCYLNEKSNTEYLDTNNMTQLISFNYLCNHPSFLRLRAPNVSDQLPSQQTTPTSISFELPEYGLVSNPCRDQKISSDLSPCAEITFTGPFRGAGEIRVIWPKPLQSQTESDRVVVAEIGVPR